MREALRWLSDHEDWRSVAIICDSKSLAKTIDNLFPTDESVQELQSAAAFCAAGKNLAISWVAGHCNLCGKELAD